MNYKIISDEPALVQFIDWLPELDTNEKFYMSLFARKKYCPEMVQSSDKTQLKRFITDKKSMVDKIKQLECEYGSYRLKDREVPQESLVLYINPNPRNLLKASYAGIRSLLHLIESGGQGFNPIQEVISCVQRAKGTKHFVDFDFDMTDKGTEVPLVMEKLNLVINTDCLTFVETRGGLHMLVNTKKIEPSFKSTWYKAIQSFSGCDQTGDQLLPVPGTIQGGFTPKMFVI